MKHTGSNAVTGQSTLYHGQAYTATLEQMAAKLAQGGEVTAANRTDGPGACFTLRLPMRPGAL